tara:strand:+ start:787 stop:1224 length:438 start_codon:yes stop_codon:yes gene_type:complete
MSNLTVTTSIVLTHEGTVYDFEKSHSLTGITSVSDNTIEDIDTATVSVLATIAAQNGGAIFKDINFIYIENKDTVNFCNIGYKDTGGSTVYFPLDAGRSIYFWNNQLVVSETGAVLGALVDWDTVTAQFDTLAGDLKVFICQVTP